MTNADNSRYQLLIFDWDGTLMDSAGKIVHCFQAAMQDLGLPMRDAEHISQQIGLGLAEAAAQLYPEDSMAQHKLLTDRYRHHFFNSDIKPPLYAGINELIPNLKQQGYTLAVATGKSRRGLERSFQEAGLKAYFSASRSAEETRSKPDPLMLMELMQEFNMPAEKTLMIGDTSFDMDMGNAAGVTTIAVDYGTHSREQLLACKPNECWSSLLDLPEWLTNH